MNELKNAIRVKMYLHMATFTVDRMVVNYIGDASQVKFPLFCILSLL